MDTPEEVTNEVGRIKLKADAEIILRTNQDFEGLIFMVRMQDPRDTRTFTVILDPDAITELGSTLLGHQIGEALQPLADILKKNLEEDVDEEGS